MSPAFDFERNRNIKLNGVQEMVILEKLALPHTHYSLEKYNDAFRLQINPLHT